MRKCIRMFLFALCSVSGLAKAYPALTLHRRQAITEVLLGYLRQSASVINEPGRADAVNSTMWLLVWVLPMDLKL